MKQEEVLNIFKKTGAILEGHFLLSSGLHSKQYLQCARVLQNPEVAEKLCSALAARFKDKKPTIVVAPALGGVIVSHEVARSLGTKGIFTERKDGKMVLRRGFNLNKTDRVLVVEDVVTTGLSTKEVINTISAYGAQLVGVGSIVNRSKNKIDFGADFEALMRIDIPVFEAEACPLCKRGVPLTKPGSRKSKY